MYINILQYIHKYIYIYNRVKNSFKIIHIYEYNINIVHIHDMKT